MGNIVKNTFKLVDPLGIDPITKTIKKGVIKYGASEAAKANGAANTVPGSPFRADTTSGYEKAVNAYITAGSPGSNGAAPFSAAWGDSFNAYFAPTFEANGITDYAQLTDAMISGASNGAYTSTPAEKGFYDYTMDNYVYPDLEADKQRKIVAQQILDQYKPTLDAQRQLVNDTLVTDANGNTALLNRELAANATAAQEQLAALGTQLAALNGNLSGELSAKAAALQEQVAALGNGLTQYTDAERAALAQRLADNFTALQTEVTAKKANLEQELATMGQAITAQDAARRDALQTELAGLTAAQQPLNDIRIKGAETLASSVNLGVQSQQDAITAQMAQQGYLGSDTGTNNALMRASLEGRAAAAKALADAKTLNATDDRSIAQHGATEGRSIADQTTAAKFQLANFGATEGRGLGDYDAESQKAIADLGAESTQNISSADAQNRLKLAQFSADENRSLADYGATQKRGIADMGATDTRSISDAAAQRKLGYFSNDITRRLASLSLPQAAVQAEFDLRNSADNYGQSGLKRSQSNLDFFNIGTASSPTNAIYTGNNSNGAGSALSNVGAGLVGLAGSIGNANNWWSKPTTAATTTPTSTWGATNTNQGNYYPGTTNAAATAAANSSGL